MSISRIPSRRCPRNGPARFERLVLLIGQPGDPRREDRHASLGRTGDGAALPQAFKQLLAGKPATANIRKGSFAARPGEEHRDAAGVLAPLGRGNARALCLDLRGVGGKQAEPQRAEQILDAGGQFAREQLCGVDRLLGHRFDHTFPLLVRDRRQRERRCVRPELPRPCTLASILPVSTESVRVCPSLAYSRPSTRLGPGADCSSRRTQRRAAQLPSPGLAVASFSPPRHPAGAERQIARGSGLCWGP